MKFFKHHRNILWNSELKSLFLQVGQQPDVLILIGRHLLQNKCPHIVDTKYTFKLLNSLAGSRHTGQCMPIRLFLSLTASFILPSKSMSVSLRDDIH